jgi:hypothetical protein
MFGHVEVEDAAAMVSVHDQDEEDAQSSGRNREGIDRDGTWLARNVRQVGEGGVRRFGISRETVRSATSRPNSAVRHGFWVRPTGLAAVIRVTGARMSALTGGRPTVGRPERLVQCSRKRRRCAHIPSWRSGLRARCPGARTGGKVLLEDLLRICCVSCRRMPGNADPRARSYRYLTCALLIVLQ